MTTSRKCGRRLKARVSHLSETSCGDRLLGCPSTISRITRRRTQISTRIRMDKSDFSTSRATTLTNRTSRECQLSYHIFLGYTETAMRRREMIRGALFWLCFPLFTGSALLTGFVVDDESVWGRPGGVTTN